ncbi:Tfp pilus assembly protein FimT/FimU [Neisseria subflava]|uniref:pilus assembly FimT family protein n=1 Tax=Neisseria subflava TaxID=28449 RepID=UPI002029E1B8|nr:Tfp pilus assembly protein FimT/FimU [Neisseria subflava]MCL9786983.1 Tfp pilus assembly protein FimT/FimU [Neisseria subflava]
MYQTQKGFTLIELLIVITIAAVMAVIALPNMNQWIASRRAASQAEQIANLLRFARNEAVRLNLPVYICPVKIKSDGSPNNGCDSKYAGNGMLSYADKNEDLRYQNDTVDLPIRSIILNGDTNKVEYSFDYIPFGTEPSALSSSDPKEVWWRFLPNGTFEHSIVNATDYENYRFVNGHIKISLTDKSAADAETKKARATVLLINGNGHVEICAKNDGRKICEYSPKNNNGIL